MNVSRFINTRTLSMFAIQLMVCSTGMAAPDAPVRMVKTFDGQVMSCADRNDEGRIAYRVTSQRGLIRAGNLEVTIEFETLKCGENAGVFGFEKASFETRAVNRFNGFVQFSNLELVGYTPDFKVVKVQPVSLNASEHRVTFVSPVSSYVGLLPRNANGNGGRRATLIALLRGQADMGDARTGKVVDRAQIPFGAFGIFLSEQENTLAFASQL